MRGIHKASHSSATAQARRDYAQLLGIAARWAVPCAPLPEGASWRKIDRQAKATIEAILKAAPLARGKLRALYPGFVAED
jgi:hypothetical protein